MAAFEPFNWFVERREREFSPREKSFLQVPPCMHSAAHITNGFLLTVMSTFTSNEGLTIVWALRHIENLLWACSFSDAVDAVDAAADANCLIRLAAMMLPVIRLSSRGWACGFNCGYRSRRQIAGGSALSQSAKTSCSNAYRDTGLPRANSVVFILVVMLIHRPARAPPASSPRVWDSGSRGARLEL
jgi:hypothetical protein